MSHYLTLYIRAFDRNLKAADLPESDELVVKKTTAVRGPFDQSLPARALALPHDEFFAGMEAKTMKPLAELIEKLNATVTI